MKLQNNIGAWGGLTGEASTVKAINILLFDLGQFTQFTLNNATTTTQALSPPSACVRDRNASFPCSVEKALSRTGSELYLFMLNQTLFLGYIVFWHYCLLSCEKGLGFGYTAFDADQ
jgi:hypothetical protein